MKMAMISDIVLKIQDRRQQSPVSLCFLLFSPVVHEEDILVIGFGKYSLSGVYCAPT